jgi:hypothetical protein
MEKDESLKCFYEWQLGNPKCNSWATNLNKLHKIWLGHILLEGDGRDLKNIYIKELKTIYDNIKRQSNRDKMKGRISILVRKYET